MASSRKSKPSNAVSNALAARVAARLKSVIQPGDRLLLALSGGIDSIVLLDVLARLANRLRFSLAALHVNHQLSPNAARWAAFCRAACRERGIAVRVARIEVPRGPSVERAARELRYAALVEAKADCIVLAHNEDDQAETVLLQLLRGAGVKGLAAMPFVRSSYPSILRPLLDVPRADIERYAKRRKLVWIEDESNEDTRHTRNWLRHELLPRIAARVPGYRATLARAAHNLGEAASLLDELAALDAERAMADGEIRVNALSGLSVARSKNLLRWLIASRGWRTPESDRLREALRQALAAKPDSKVVVDLGECELRVYGGALHLLPARDRARERGIVTWHGEREIAFPGLGGVLTMTRRRGTGLSVARLGTQPVTIRARQGGERLQPDANRPRRTVKNLLQEARMPPWQRERLPFIYCGETLACIPGVAVDYRFQAQRGEASILPVWRER